MQAKTVKFSRVIMAHMMLPQDANPAGIVHGGVVMRHIDDAAAVVAVRHAGSNAVTASIDRLDFHNPVFIGNLLTIKASLNLAGKSSMEIGVRVEAEDLLSGKITHTASAYLTFVALGEDSRPQSIAPLTVVTDEDKRRNAEALIRRDSRLRQKSIAKECQPREDNCK